MEAGLSACSLHNWQAGRRNAVAGFPQVRGPQDLYLPTAQRTSQACSVFCPKQCDVASVPPSKGFAVWELSGGGEKGLRNLFHESNLRPGCILWYCQGHCIAQGNLSALCRVGCSMTAERPSVVRTSPHRTAAALC